MNKDERFAAAKEFVNNVDWDTYDYTTSPGADMSFPDFEESELENKPIWIGKHYNKTSGWETCHVPDLNGYADGYERRLMALYGVPVSFPRRDKEEGELLALIAELDAARAEGGDTWAEAMDQHGMLNDEHYVWMRGRQLGFPKTLNDYYQAVAAFGKLDEALAAGDTAALAQYGIPDATHFAWCKAHLARVKDRAWKQHDALLAEKNQELAQQFEANKTALAGELAPIKGVSLEDWAVANVKIMGGMTIDDIIKVLGITRAVWDEVNGAWNQRMATDTTMTVATVYGNAFTGAVKGRF